MFGAEELLQLQMMYASTWDDIEDDICPHCGFNHIDVWPYEKVLWSKDKTARDEMLPYQLMVWETIPFDPIQLSPYYCIDCLHANTSHDPNRCSCGKKFNFLDFEHMLANYALHIEDAYFPGIATTFLSQQELDTIEDYTREDLNPCYSCMYQGTSSCKPLLEWAVVWMASTSDAEVPVIYPCHDFRLDTDMDNDELSEWEEIDNPYQLGESFGDDFDYDALPENTKKFLLY